MNTYDSPRNPLGREVLSGSAEETLRLIAGLPAPEGLEDRLEAALRSAPRAGRVLSWPVHLPSDRPWFRTAAAAAIAFVIAGGGWGVYSRVERQQPASVIAAPASGPAAGGFSNAGAIRTPQTLNGPVPPATPADASAAGKKLAMPESGQKKKAAKKKPKPAAAARTAETAAAPDPARN